MSRLDAARELVAIGSISRAEAQLASYVESRLRASTQLDVERIGDNVVAKTTGPKRTRVIVAGHLDTVPGDARDAHIVDNELRGLGACDMKGSLSVMIELALDPSPRSVEVTWVFYAREEISRDESGLVEIAQLRPDLIYGDVAILAEPTNCNVEAGCQGSLRVEITLGGARAHTSRPFTGRNAIHRAAGVIDRVAHYVPREVEMDGVTFVEQLQVVAVQGGVAPNVVPDRVTMTLNHRVAPDRSNTEAMKWLRSYLESLLEEEDTLKELDWAPSARPSLSHQRIADLIERTGRPPRAKVGWTDVATFLSMSIPATNFGAGDPLLAHRSDEYVTLEQLDEFASVLGGWLA